MAVNTLPRKALIVLTRVWQANYSKEQRNVNNVETFRYPALKPQSGQLFSSPAVASAFIYPV